MAKLRIAVAKMQQVCVCDPRKVTCIANVHSTLCVLCV